MTTISPQARLNLFLQQFDTNKATPGLDPSEMQAVEPILARGREFLPLNAKINQALLEARNHTGGDLQALSDLLLHTQDADLKHYIDSIIATHRVLDEDFQLEHPAEFLRYAKISDIYQAPGPLHKWLFLFGEWHGSSKSVESNVRSLSILFNHNALNSLGIEADSNCFIIHQRLDSRYISDLSKSSLEAEDILEMLHGESISVYPIDTNTFLRDASTYLIVFSEDNPDAYKVPLDEILQSRNNVMVHNLVTVMQSQSTAALVGIAHLSDIAAILKKNHPELSFIVITPRSDIANDTKNYASVERSANDLVQQIVVDPNRFQKKCNEFADEARNVYDLFLKRQMGLQ